MSDTVSVFVNGTATTENYTYGHTLSLHDALPIWPRCRHLQALGRRAIGEHRHGGSDKADAAISAPGRRQYPAIWGALLRRPDAGRPPQRLRSEEHTSELQSLMRISYAVFCLKKKKNK